MGAKIQAQLTSDLLVLVLAVLNTTGKDGSLIGENQTVLVQVSVTSVQDSVKHGLVEEEVAHPLGDDDVELVDGERNVLKLALHKRDRCAEALSARRPKDGSVSLTVLEAIGLDDFAGLIDDVGHIDLRMGT